jgi:hypothetical protein
MAQQEQEQADSVEVYIHFAPTRDPAERGMGRLERKQAALTQRQELEALLKANEVTRRNDADGNAAIRANFRSQRKGKKHGLQEGVALGWRPGVALSSGTIQDQVHAKSAMYGDGKRQEQERMAKLRQSGIFDEFLQGKKRHRWRESESTHLSIPLSDTAPSSHEARLDGVCSTTTSSR